MHSKTEILSNNMKKKLMSSYIIFTLFATSIIMMVPITIAEGNDVITTYFYDGSLVPEIDFDINDTVFVNITVDNVTGDDDPPFSLIAVNENTSEWITFFVTDNQSGLWGSNTPNDGEYWGVFNLSYSEITSNASVPGDMSILQVNSGHIINISEINGGLLDNDSQIAFRLISVHDFGPPPGPGGLFVNTTVCGFVNDTSGNPLSGVNVSACNMSENWCNSSFTNESGYFEFMVFSGDFEVRANKSGYMDNVSYRFFNENDSVCLDIVLSDGGPGGCNGSVMGFVKNDSGFGLGGLTVYLNGSMDYFVVTNETGWFLFDGNVSCGHYSSEVFGDGFSDFGPDVDLDEGDVCWLNFTFDVGGDPPDTETVNITVFGFVYQDFTPDYPVSNANITIFTNGNPDDVLGMTITDEEGHFEMVFQPNMTAAYYGNDQVMISIDAEGYMSFNHQEGVWWLIDDMNCQWEVDGAYIEKIWETTAMIMGQVVNETGVGIEEASIMVEGPDYYFNQTQSDENGNFEMHVINGELELCVQKDGYFMNCTEYNLEGSVTDPPLYVQIEEIPDTNAWINGSVTSDGSALQYVEVMLIDPLHPDQGMKEEMPMTNDLGFFNISTYPGQFKLVTVARMIGEQMDAPPIGIGGYSNEIVDVIVNDSESKVVDIVLSEAVPDEISISLSMTDWENGNIQMVRTVEANAKVLRTLIDEDISGTISALEIETLCEDINTSMGGMEHFEEQYIFAGIPFTNCIDDIRMNIQQPTIEIEGIEVNSSIDSSNPITVYINGTIGFSGSIDASADIHSFDLDAYYDNPAFVINYTLIAPTNFTFIDATDEYITVNGLNSSTVTINMDSDSNENDTTFTEDVYLLATSSDDDLFAEIYSSYYVETPLDADGDTDYDFLLTKFKFNTSQNGGFRVTGTLKSQSGTILAQDDHDANYQSGTKLVELSFDGKEINKKHKDGPYRVVINLFYEQNDTYVWIDSIDKTTQSYVFTDFTSPPLYFTGGIADSGVDEDDNDLYDYFVLSVDVYVGDTGNYEIEADIGLADFNYNGDPFIAHVRKDATFMDAGSQTYNISFDGSLIYQKGTNASLWVNVRARSYTEGNLDEAFTMTDKYYYSDFERPLPESCLITGNVTDVYGQGRPVEVRLMNLNTYSENSTNSDDNGTFSINAQPGQYELNVWCSSGSNYEDHWEYINIGSSDENETIDRNITLLPYWHECTWLDWMMDSWQYASGQPIYINITAQSMPYSNTTLEVYRQREIEDFSIQEFVTSYSNVTDSQGSYNYIINTSSFSNGRYNFMMCVYNETQQTVARGDAWDVQISSISLDFDLNRQNYRPGSTGQGTYQLEYISNQTEVVGGTYQWSILYWDWMGEHVLDSGSFTNDESGNGTFNFTIPSTILDYGDWFDLRFKATDPSETEVQAWRGFGITSGSAIDAVTDSAMGNQDDYSGILLNITVNITSGQAGNYRVQAGLNDQYWWWITGNETEEYLDVGDNWVYINLEGDQIRNSGRPGPYKVWVGLYPAGDWNELDNYEYTINYNYTDFCTPDVFFDTGEEITNYTIGTVDNYDALIVNVSINSSVFGNYSVHANLHSETDQGGWIEWHHVAWNRSETIEVNNTNVNTSISVPIRFEGMEIYGSNQNGPWKLNLNLHRVTESGWEEWMSVYDPNDELNYNYDQFTKPSAFVENIIDYGSSTGDLCIGVRVNVTDGQAGMYQVNGNLHSSHAEGHWWIDNCWNQTHLDNGTNIVNITFSGSAIYSSGYNGPYNVFIDLQKTEPSWSWLGGNEYDTDSHSFTDFSMPEAVFVGTCSDEGVDADGDGYYDYLRLTIPIEFNASGHYEINGELYQEDEITWSWYWITWAHKECQIENGEEGIVNVTLDLSGTEIRKSGREGTYGVNLWLRDINSASELGYLNVDLDNSYTTDEFEQAAVRFSDDSPLYDNLSTDGSMLNVTLKIVASETGTYRLHGMLHKVIQHPGWEEWFWLTSSEEELEITDENETTVVFSFDTAMIKSSGYNGPYMAEFDLMDENWMNIDFLRDYETDAYQLTELAASPANFTGIFSDYLYPSTAPEYVKVDVEIDVNQSGNYEIGGDLHKESGWNWNFIAGAWQNQYLSTGVQNVTLQFDAIEILDNIDMLGLDYSSGDTFDLDVWLRRSGEPMELDHLSDETINTYQVSNFTSSFSAVIDQISDNGYNESDDASYEYLNITAQITFNEAGEYELWCDLNKETDTNWYWIGWKNQFITVTSPGTQNITLQFSGERISSEGYDGPYRYHMELWDWNEGKRLDKSDGQTQAYSVSDFVGSSVSFNDSTATAEGIDSSDAGSEYDYLLIEVNVTSDSTYNVEFRGDLHKESDQNGWQWISCKSNWTTISQGETTVTLRFDGGIIRSGGIDGPYQIRVELWDTNNWQLLDVIDRLETDSYTYDNFQAASAEIIRDNVEDYGLGANNDGKYEYLQINVSVNVSNAGNYEVMGDLHSETNGWHWLGWTNNWTYLESGSQTVNLRFNGLQIKNEGVNGPYKVRLELRDDTGDMLSMVDPYETGSYSYSDFQGSGVELISASDMIVQDGEYLELNLTVNCTTSGSYWIGTDLHKESGWDWQWISWESVEGDDLLNDSGLQNVTINFSGQMIRNSEINGPYQIRIELRDMDTWEELDRIERYDTNSYNYTDFAEPAVSIISIEDYGNDTNSDSLYNYLDMNLTINCTQAGTYWLMGDLHKEEDWNWQWIGWKGREITLSGTGEQPVKLQFDGEQIYNRGINGPYQVHFEICNLSTGLQLDTYDRYNTESYGYDDFQRSSIEFIENDTSPSDRGVGTVGSYTDLEVNVTVFSESAGTYWLNADLHKQSGWNWQWIAWQGQEITHTGSGNENFTILFEGGQIRNKGINGPYQVRLELNSVSGEWKQYDMIEEYQTSLYNATDFSGSGTELVEPSDATVDQISNGNLVINVTVNSSTAGTYEIGGDLHKEENYNWRWICWNSTQVEVTSSGEQTFTLTFDGSEIYGSGIDGPYDVRVDLKKVGTWSLIDDYKYQTNRYNATNFSAPSSGLNNSEFSDWAPNNDYLEINVTSYSLNSREYQFDCWLHGGNYEFIGWNKTVATVDGYDDVEIIRFDAGIINNSGVDPAKAYIEMRRTSDGALIDFCEYDLQGTYTADDFGLDISIDGSSIVATVWDADSDGYNDSLNITVNITLSGDYEISAGLRDNATRTWITGDYIPFPFDPYSGTTEITLHFDGMKIFKSGKNGPYVVSFIALSKSGIGEVLRETNVFVTSGYQYTDFQHPDVTDEDANFTGTYASTIEDTDDSGLYNYLVINATVNVSTNGTYDFYADLYTGDGATWIAADTNYSLNLTEGTQIVQFRFEGDEIYASQENGPYLLGYVRVGADIDGSWMVLDEQSNVHTTSSYDYDDFENASQSPLGDVFSGGSQPTGVDSITFSNDPFSPDSDGTKDSTLITVSADTGQTLYLNIYNETNTIVRTGMPLSANGGSYTATWQGKDDGNSVVPDGTYRFKVSIESSGAAVNESETTGTVVVDTAAPTGSTITINSGDSYTNSTTVTLALSATDDSDKKMRFKNSGGSWTDWEDFQNSKTWTLTSTDGSKTVYFQAKDTAGNIATEQTDSIILDTTAPSQVNITITGKGDTPSTHTNDVSVTLSISAEDATSGVQYMKLSNDMDFSDVSWINYTTSKEWTLNSGDGTKTVYIKVKDRVGKESSIYLDNITLDTTAPTLSSVSIDSGQTYTNTTNVTLTISATGAAKMQFKNGSYNWSSWESFSSSKTWNLLSGGGTKTVYCRLKDTAGNIATSKNDTIILDQTAPTISAVDSSSISQTSATITWTTNEGATSYVEYGTTTDYGTNTTLDSTKVTSHSEVISGLSPGTTYHFKVKSMDAAGNERTSSDDTFATSSGSDTTAPSAIAGLSVSDKVNAEKTLTVTWNQSSASDFAGYKVYRRTSSFTNVSASGVQLLTTITSRTTVTYDDASATDGTTFYYAVTAIDTATPPNEDQDVTSVSAVSVDDKAPSTTDNIPVGWQTAEVTVTLTATDSGEGVNKTYYTTDGSNPSNSSNTNRTQYTAPFTVGEDNEIGDGTWTIKYYSYDRNSTPNEEAIHTKTLKVDTADPTTTDNAPSGWQNSSVSVSLSASDTTSGVSKTYYTRDGSTPTTLSNQYSTPILFTTDGTKTLKYFSKDVATNAESVHTTTILIDATAPSSSITALSSYSSVPFNVSWSSSDATSGVANVTIQYRNGSGSWTNWLTGQNASGTASFNSTYAADGYTYYFRSIATDNASNQESVSTYDAFTTTLSSAITAEISSPVDATDGITDDMIYVAGNVTFTGSATCQNFSIYYLNYSSDNVTWTNIASGTTPVSSSTLGTLNTSASELSGNYTVRLFVLSNESSNNSVTITIIVDNTAPTISTGPSASVSTDSATIIWTTNESTNATVEYGSTTSYGSTVSGSASTFETSHSESITGLSSSTTYHYRVLSYDKAGNLVNSSDATFTTSEETSGDTGGGGGFAPPVETETNVTDDPPTISNIYHEPTMITSNDFVGIYATVTDDNTVSYVTLYWTISGNEQSKSMSLRNDNIYSAEIGPFVDGERISYHITARDNASQTSTSSTSTFTVVDEAGPTVTIRYPKSGMEIFDQTPTIRVRYSDPSGIDTESIVFTLDGNSYTSLATITDTSLEYAPTSDMSLGTHTVKIVVSDTLGNTEDEQWSFTIKESETVIEEEVGDIAEGENVNVKTNNAEETGIEGIDIVSNKDLSNVKVTVAKLEEKPDGITEDVDKNVYSYIEIELTADDEEVDESSIGTLTISFKVELSWFNERNIDKDSVVLMRYHDGAWQELSTTYVSEDSLYVYYTAETPGFSTFAIAGMESSEAPQELPWIFIMIGVLAALIVAILALFKTGIIKINK